MAYPPASIVAVSIILPLIALVAVCLRFWVRLRVQPTFLGADDWLVLGAVIFCLGDGANLAFAAVRGIQGRDYPGQIPEDRSILEAKSDYAQVILEKPLYAMMKLSVLFFFRRIFLVQKNFRRLNNVMIGLIISWAVAYFLAEIFVCGSEPSVLWTPDAPRTSCVNQTWLNFTFAITDVIGDILVVAMPYPVIRKLHMGQREKIGLISIFLLGTLSTVASIIRLGFISKAFTQNYGAAGNNHAAGTPPAVWSTVEASIGVLAACLPPLGPLIRKTPNPRKASVSLYNRYLTRSDRKKSLTVLDPDRKNSATTVELPSRKQSSGEQLGDLV